MDRSFMLPATRSRSRHALAASAVLHLTLLGAVVSFARHDTPASHVRENPTGIRMFVASLPPVVAAATSPTRQLSKIIHAPAPSLTTPASSIGLAPSPQLTADAAASQAPAFAPAREPAQLPERTSGAIVVGGFDRIAGDNPARVSPAESGVIAGAFGNAVIVSPRQVDSTISVSLGGFGDAGAAESAPGVADDKPQVIGDVKPRYTAEALAGEVQGEVILRVVLRADRRVEVLSVVKGLGHGLDEAAIDAALRIPFLSARHVGVPVDFETTVRVIFRLMR